MTNRYEVFKCETCKDIVEVMISGSGQYACCGQPMKCMKEGTTDGAREKHVPVIEKSGNEYTVKVGAVPHPMQPEHWIQWVELVADGISYTRFLNPGDAPEAKFTVDAENVYAREYCNLHGHWKSS